MPISTVRQSVIVTFVEENLQEVVHWTWLERKKQRKTM